MHRLRLGAVVLAAGEGRRFGASPKQLLVPNGVTTLVSRAVEAAIGAGAERVVVGTGAHREAVERVVRGASRAGGYAPAVECAYNERWREGPGTTLALALRRLLTYDVDACFVSLADQPAVTSAALRGFAERLNGHDAVALAYPSGAGVPALLTRALAERLTAKPTGRHQTAKALLRHPATDTALVDAPALRRDIDTAADWLAWRRHLGH